MAKQLKDSNAIIFCFDMTNKATFLALPELYSKVIKELAVDDIIMVLVGMFLS